jgi:hypothetical protein
MTNRLRIGAHIYLFIRKVLLRSTVCPFRHPHVRHLLTAECQQAARESCISTKHIAKPISMGVAPLPLSWQHTKLPPCPVLMVLACTPQAQLAPPAAWLPAHHPPPPGSLKAALHGIIPGEWNTTHHSPHVLYSAAH